MGGLLPGVDVESRWPIITNTCGLVEYAHQHPRLSNTATPKRKARRYQNEILRHKEYLEEKQSLLREVLKEYAKSIDISWSFDESTEDKIPEPFKGKVSSGWCYWDLDQLKDINHYKNELVQTCFIELDVPGAEQLLSTFAFLTVPNGDYLLIDMQAPDAPIIYLSHEMDKMHGCRLGNSFIDFIEKWTLIGCVGPEDWQFEPFIKDVSAGIDANSPIATRFREFVGFDPHNLKEAEILAPEHLITPQSDKEWFHSLLGDTWERKYEIVIEEIETHELFESIIPAINGAFLNEAEYKNGVEKAGTHRLISFKECINPKLKKNDF